MNIWRWFITNYDSNYVCLGGRELLHQAPAAAIAARLLAARKMSGLLAPIARKAAALVVALLVTSPVSLQSPLNHLRLSLSLNLRRRSLSQRTDKRKGKNVWTNTS